MYRQQQTMPTPKKFKSIGQLRKYLEGALANPFMSKDSRRRWADVAYVASKSHSHLINFFADIFGDLTLQQFLYDSRLLDEFTPFIRAAHLMHGSSSDSKANAVQKKLLSHELYG